MSEFNLRMPYLIYLSIASMFLGVLLAPLVQEVPVAGTSQAMRDHAMMHGTLQVPAETAPKIDIEIVKDSMAGWNLTVLTENFSFTPQTVNGDNVENTGHAHLYVNGIKMARLYSRHFHIPDLPVGEHVVSVNLSSNDHSYYLVNGVQIEARKTISQEASDPSG